MVMPMPKLPCILFRKGFSDSDDEIKAATANFRVESLRSQVPENRLVIGRYSVLPYYKELEEDLEESGSVLINSYRQHRYIANLANWYQDLEGLTPKTWFRLQDLPEGKSFVLKGETNSKKFQWSTHMFAADRVAAGEVYSRLQADSMIASQEICIREYVPLRNLGTDIGGRGLPITEEYRFFVCRGQVLTGGFYWSSHPEFSEDPKLGLSPDNVPREFLQDVISRVGANADFYVIDIARTQDGSWMVVELNDGQMSGLSENDPKVLYSRLAEVVK